jgi:hypothetical protein
MFKNYSTLEAPRKAVTASLDTGYSWRRKRGIEQMECKHMSVYGIKKKCLQVKGLTKNLFSVPSAVARGANSNVAQAGVEIVVNGQIIGVNVKSGNLYHLKIGKILQR